MICAEVFAALEMWESSLRPNAEGSNVSIVTNRLRGRFGTREISRFGTREISRFGTRKCIYIYIYICIYIYIYCYIAI